MASFSTDVCDRCGAQFPRDSNPFRKRKVHRITIETLRSYGKDERKVEVCDPCRDSFYDLYETWKGNK